MQDFNLAMAATMGACSFEAYNAPYRMHGVKEVDDNHSETVYMHRPFLDRIMSGILQVMQLMITVLSSRLADLWVSGTADVWSKVVQIIDRALSPTARHALLR